MRLALGDRFPLSIPLPLPLPLPNGPGILTGIDTLTSPSPSAPRHTHTRSISSTSSSSHSTSPHDETRGAVYYDDIPGTRCGPEDGPWPREYRMLSEEEDVWRELSVLARPQMKRLRTTMRADSLNFQPCARARTQDRYLVKDLDVHGQVWTLTGVLDGHLGEATVEHVAHHLPQIILELLQSHPSPSQSHTASSISSLLTHALTSFDAAIANDVLSLFPGGLAGLAQLTDAHISSIINDQHRGGSNYKKARLCMYGTTALIALVDPGKEGMWVANVGDCQAAMVTPVQSCHDEEEEEWHVEFITDTHNGDNPKEITRLHLEHPNEPDCVSDGRVLGALAPFRCLGDIPFKQPPEFSRRILYNLEPGFHDKRLWEEFLVRNRTPPYISAVPEVTYRRLDGGAHQQQHHQHQQTQHQQQQQTQGHSRLVPLLNGILNGLRKAGGGGGGGSATTSGTVTPSLGGAATPSAHHHHYPMFPADVHACTPTPSSSSSAAAWRRPYLVLFSDGFADLCARQSQRRVLERWAGKLRFADTDLNGLSTVPIPIPTPPNDSPPTSSASSISSYTSTLSTTSTTTRRTRPLAKGKGSDNLALRLLREVLGGEDRERVSKVVTMEMDVAWIDDTSIVVLGL